MRHTGLPAQLPLSSVLPSGHCPRICGIAWSEKGPPWHVHLSVNAPTAQSTAQLSQEEQQRGHSCLIPGLPS